MNKVSYIYKGFIKYAYKTEVKLFSISLLVFFIVFKAFPSNRVGDGSEYILQYIAFLHGNTPWITSDAIKAYDVLVNSSQINYLADSDSIRKNFSSLIIGNNFDLNHFWLYSGLAAFLHTLFKLLDFELSVTSAFILFHAFLFSTVLTAAWKKFKLKGILSVLLLLFGSPLIWYGNKIHTEFFTFTMVLLTVIYATKQLYAFAALPMALASTQNPSFTVLAGILLILDALENRKKYLSKRKICLTTLTLSLCAIHPLYYLWRQGVITPQLKAGGASVTGSFDHFFLWLIDPDVGLFPNWPLGILLLISTFSLLAKEKMIFRNNRRLLLFVALFVMISLYSQSSTTVLNSGGTPGLGRYALWYIGLFFPASLLLMGWLSSNFNNLRFYIGLGFLFILLSTSMYSNAPLRPEQYINPSISSKFVQTHLSSFYSPPIPIFVGRYSGIGEDLSISAVVGPDCRKIAIIADLSRTKPISPGNCAYSFESLKRYVFEKQVKLRRDTYFWINDQETLGLRLTPSDRVMRFSTGEEGSQILGSGWSNPESWGVWTDSRLAEIFIPCSKDGQVNQKTVFRLNSFGTQQLNFSLSGSSLISLKLENAVNQSIEIAIPKKECRNGKFNLVLELPNAKSPKSTGLNEDTRLLGIGLTQISIDVGGKH